jgi:hypothetical protein
MSASLLKSVALISLITVYSHALFGIGGQYSPNFAAKVDGSSDIISGSAGNPNLSLDRHSATGLTGFGGKIWIDFLPFIDLELTSNIQFVRYDASLSLNKPNDTNKVDMKVETGLPGFSEATPVFGKISTDISILYPFLELPPVIKMIKLYAGAGVTHFLSVKVLDKKFAKDALGSDFDVNATTDVKDASDEIAKALKKESLVTGFGGHLVAGAKLKPPVVPIAVFVNGKIHIGGDMPDAVSSGFTLEIGAALAF